MITHEMRKEFKKKARGNVKKHYFLYIILIFIASLLGTDYDSASLIFSARTGEKIISESSLKSESYVNVLIDLLNGDVEAGSRQADDEMNILKDRAVKIGNIEFGHTDGIFSGIVNSISSGSILLNIFSAIVGITGSNTAATMVFIILALIFNILKLIFITLAFEPVYIRAFLEGGTYERVRPSSLIYLFRSKRFVKASLAMLRLYFTKVLWAFTIVGYPIICYRYAMVRYIIAENPTCSGKEAMKLSSQMMKGHKWELFIFDLSFIAWDFLSYITAGLFGTFFVYAYEEAATREYFVYLRNKSINDGIGNAAEIFNDRYLYEKAPTDLINTAYADVIAFSKEKKIELAKMSKIRTFFSDVFGVVLHYDKHEQQYREYTSKENRIASFKENVEGRTYPARLSPIPISSDRKRLEHVYYLRHYSLSALILMFFIFCVFGWLWEVSIHIVQDGVFVNRGVLHGPWLPIYGSGGVMILMVLNKFRKNPAVEFVAAVLLCGVVEYATSAILEVMHNGQKWWDYSGYFLNINGRVCAEGLLIFGLAGIAAVYCFAPLLDNCLARIPRKAVGVICALLLTVFVADNIYSRFNPNTGKGITDYGTESDVTAQQSL